LKKQSQFARAEYRVLYTAKMNLKKQTQFVCGQTGVNSYLKGNYDNMAFCETRKNKAN